jgi:FtsH-binding integral membrane protein
MNNNFNNQKVIETYDSALRSYFLKVYNYMGFGLIITAIMAFAVANSPTALKTIYGTPLQYVVMFAPLVFMLVLSFGINKLKASTAQMLFWLFCMAMGLSLSSIFLVYTGVSIVRVFLITSATFLVMSIYGYTTNTDLSKFGSILMMGLIGIIIASLVNLFLKSSGLDFIISLVGVVVFTGLIGYDTQRMKTTFDEAWDNETYKKVAIYSALSLYINFINLFLMLLRLVGQRRD